MSFQLTQLVCPDCSGEVTKWAHPNGPSNIRDPRNWYYTCANCSFYREAWIEKEYPIIERRTG